MINTRTARSAAHPCTSALAEPACRLCGTRLIRTLIDLGYVPLTNRTLVADAPDDALHRLHLRICDHCTLVQLADVTAPTTFIRPTPHVSQRSAAGLRESKRHAEVMRKQLRLNDHSLVIEIGSRNGTLLPHFQAAGIPVLGVESAATDDHQVPTAVGLFNTETAMEIAVQHGCADLVIATNVLAHAPDLFDFAAGLCSILRPNGVLILQVPHLLSLVQKMQFDAFRHDCYTYLSLHVLEQVLRPVGLRVFDAERLPDHGGSLRIHACHAAGPHAARPGLKAVRLVEGFAARDVYAGFSDRVSMARDEIRDFLETRRIAGRRMVAYGAVTRGGTLLNCCGITTQQIAYVADPDPAKHGRLLAGSRIPIRPVETLMDDPPDDILILPWPNAAEIGLRLLPLRHRGTQLWTAVPKIMRL